MTFDEVDKAIDEFILSALKRQERYFQEVRKMMGFDNRFYMALREFLLMGNTRMITISGGNINQPDERQVTFVRDLQDEDGRRLMPRVFVNKFSIYEDCWKSPKQAALRAKELLDTAEATSIWVPPEYTMASRYQQEADDASQS